MTCVFYSLMVEYHHITDSMVDSTIGIANDSGLDGGGLSLRKGKRKIILNPQILQDFSSPQCQSQIWGPPSLQPNGKRGSFPAVKVGRTEADTLILSASRNDKTTSQNTHSTIRPSQ